MLRPKGVIDCAKTLVAGLVSSSDRTMDFVVTRRPQLAEITEHPKMDFADYERRLTSLQGALQLIQQAYLGTSERALLVLEGWDTAGKGGIVRRLGWALDPRSFKVHPIAAPDEHERAQHYLQQPRDDSARCLC
jgi:polyphosphate kinase 2 (PPK2 family)